jgi:hypothetical protein
VVFYGLSIVDEAKWNVVAVVVVVIGPFRCGVLQFSLSNFWSESHAICPLN